MASLDADAVDAYLDRIGLDPSDIRSLDPTLETLTRLQRAHVTTVPFENLSIVGDPFDAAMGDGVHLDIDHLHEKIVTRGHGGYCFELNGLFTSLLDELGFDVHRAAAMVLNDDDDDDDHSTPANHHVVIVSLDRSYLVDVGMNPQMRRPTPLDGAETPADEAGKRWRVVENDRPNYDLRAEYRIDDGKWNPRYDLDRTPRELSYFQATCDYLSSAPESYFANNAVVCIAENEGRIELKEESFARVSRGERSERDISPDEWYELLEQEFGLSVRT